MSVGRILIVCIVAVLCLVAAVVGGRLTAPGCLECQVCGDPLERFYLGVFATCSWLSYQTRAPMNCINFTKMLMRYDLHNFSAPGWKWPLVTMEENQL